MTASTTAIEQQTTPNEVIIPSAEAGPIVFFDGDCGLCDRFVQFVLKHDHRARLRFAPLQGSTFSEVRPHLDVEPLSTVVLATRDDVQIRSEAVRRVLNELGGIWAVSAGLLWLIPRPIRDLGYRMVASVRQRIFGRAPACRLLTPEQRERFLN